MTASSVTIKSLSSLKSYCCSVLAVFIGSSLVLLPSLASAQNSWDYSKDPLFWSQGVKPNVALMLDNSMSMTALVADSTFQTAKNTSGSWQLCTGFNDVNGTCTSGTNVADTFSVKSKIVTPISAPKLTVSRTWYNSGGSSTDPATSSCTSSRNGFIKQAGRTASTTASSNFTPRKIAICLPDHGIRTGDAVTLTNSSFNGSGMPLNTTYYATSVTQHGFKLATSPANATSGIALDLNSTVNLGSSGSFTVTVSPTKYYATSTTYIGSTVVSYCDTTQTFGRNYLGQSGSRLAGYVPIKEENVGVFVRNSSSNPSITACVRWQMASTQGSVVNTTMVGTKVSGMFDGNATDYTSAGDTSLNGYGKHLLNTYVKTNKSNVNLDAMDDVIPGVNRIQAAREAAQSVVSEFYEKMNIGLFAYNAKTIRTIPKYGSSPSTMLDNLIGANKSLAKQDLPASALDGAIGGLTASEYTYLATTQKHINDYFKKPYSVDEKGGPIAYRCQKNYAIIMTDGLPYTSDKGELEEVAFDGFQDLITSGTDQDGKSFQADPWKTQNVIPYVIGFGLENDLLRKTPLVNRISIPASDIASNTFTLKDHGLKSGDVVGIASSTTAKTTTVYYAAVINNDKFRLVNDKSKVQNCINTNNTTNCVGMSGGKVISTGPGKSFFSFTPEQLAADLSQVFREADNITSSASAVSANSKQVGGDTLVYQAKFTTKDWSGAVTAYPITVDGNGKAEVNTNVEPTSKGWSTKQTLKSRSQRSSNIFTWSKRLKVSGGVTKQLGPMEFVATDSMYDNLAADQQTALGANKDEALNTVRWLLGEEITGFRARESENGLLGDVINADPEYLGALNFGYEALPSSAANCSGTSCTGKEQYAAYVQDRKLNRTPVLFVGTNHGFVHALNAQTGEEMAAYVPAGVYTDWQDTISNGERDTTEASIHKFRLLRTYPYKHEFLVDGSATVADAFNGSTWKTYLVGGLGAGGRSVYALDVTDQANFSSATSLVKWELIDPDLGYSYGKPIIARMKDGKWYAIFPNGLDSNEDKARVFIVDIESGAVVKKLLGNDTDGPNGMMAVQVRLDATRTVLDIYAGDIRGNIWRFDVSSESSSSWSTSGSRVFQAKDSSGHVQSITGGLRLGAHPGGLGTIVYFGTGKYFEVNDNAYSADTRPRDDAFYAVLDTRQGSTVNKSSLVEQELTQDGDIRQMNSPKDVSWEKGAKGWYIKLPDAGERIISSPLIFGGRVIFTSIVPSGEGSCEGSGYGWLNEVDALTGKQFDKPVLDTNNDGRISSNEELASSVKVTGGLPSDPSVLGGGEHDYKMMGTTSQTNSIQFISETQVDTEGLKGGSGRMSWQQLQ